MFIAIFMRAFIVQNESQDQLTELISTMYYNQGGMNDTYISIVSIYRANNSCPIICASLINLSFVVSAQNAEKYLHKGLIFINSFLQSHTRIYHKAMLKK